MQGGCLERKGKAPFQTCKVDSTTCIFALQKGFIYHMKLHGVGLAKGLRLSRFHSVAKATLGLAKGLHLSQAQHQFS